MAQGTVEAPVIRAAGQLPVQGEFRFLTKDPVRMTLEAGPEAVEIYYTTDGGLPDPGMPGTSRYSETGPFELVPPAMVRAMVETEAFDYSDLAEARLLFVASHSVVDGTLGGGGFTVSPEARDYPEGTTVTLTATGLPGWQFLRWEGDHGGTNPVSSLVVDGPKTVRAVFGTGLQTSVNSIAGQPGGTVALEPASGPYPHGSLVRLMALPATGRAFSGWSNNPAWTNQPLLTVVVTNANVAYRALFQTLSATSGSNTVSIKVTGGGVASRSPDLPRAVYRNGSVVEIRPYPDPGWVFVGWSGDAVGAANPLKLLVNTNKVVVANFSRRAPGEAWIEGLDLAEYFWDEAPLEGQGTLVPLAGGDSWIPGPLDMDVSRLAPGLHRLGMRVRDDQRRWSEIAWRPVMVESGEDLLAGVAEWPGGEDGKGLVAAEYFWDVDPGVGKGLSLPASAGETWLAGMDGGLEVPVEGLAAGLHRMGMRVKDGRGRWSDVAWGAVLVEGGQDLLAGVEEWPGGEDGKGLVAAEYFWDVDPGVGKGLSLPASAGETWLAGMEGGLEVPVQGLAAGLHRMGMRVKDGRGRWSDVAWGAVLVEGGQDLLAGVAEWPGGEDGKGLVAAEYFWDVDPGMGLGTAVECTPGETLDLAPGIGVDVDGLPAGLHQLGFRVRDGMGRWSGTTWTRIRLEATDELLNGVADWPGAEEDQRLVRAEYFWDLDPGVGRGRPVTIPPSHSLVADAGDSPGLEVDVPSLSLGVHRMGFRVLDGRGRWSEVTWWPFLVERDVRLGAVQPALPAEGGVGIAALALADWRGDGRVSGVAGGDFPLRGLAFGVGGVETHLPPGLPGLEGVVTAAWGDLNNDGWPDLALGLGGETGGLRLFINLEGGGFAAAGEGSTPRDVPPVSSMAWADLDRDGFLDLVLACPTARSVEVLWNRDGVVLERRDGMQSLGGLGGRWLALMDWNGDGAADLAWLGPGGLRMYQNEGGGRFSELFPPPVPDGGDVSGVLPGDFDNDGDVDLVLLHRSHGADVLRNGGRGDFGLDGMAWGATPGLSVESGAVVDLEGDGWADLVLLTAGGSAVVMRNLRDGKFEQDATGLGIEGGSRVVVADVDRTGTPDLVLGGVDGAVQWVSNGIPGTHWLRVRPRSVSSNRSAIGARVSVGARVDGRWVVQSREIQGGNGFGGQDEMLPWFGLGDAQRADWVRVEWPSGLTTEQRDLPVDGTVVVDEVPEGSPVVRVNGEFRADGVHEFTGMAEVEVTLASTFPGANIHYSLDGNPADIRSARYEGPFRVRPPAVIRAAAYSAGYREFAEAEPVRLVFIPSYPLAAGTEGGGRVDVLPWLEQYRSNSLVQVSAVAAPGWTFLRWEGDVAGTNVTQSLAMNSAKGVRAVFGTRVTSTVTGGAASGVVVMEPAGDWHAFGSRVRLSAVPAAGKGFESWNANSALTQGLLTVHVTNATPAYNALFVPLRSDERSVVLEVTGRGAIVSNPRRGIVPAGTTVVLDAVADEGWAFESWGGDLSGGVPSRTMVVNANLRVSASFRPVLIQVPPSITSHPADVNLTSGQVLELAVVASGSPPLSYQWHVGTHPIPGATLPTFLLNPAREENSGSYQVVVQNPLGSVTSRVAQVTVERPPNRTPVAVLRSPGAGVVFEHGAPIRLQSWAVDVEGQLDRVEFIVDGLLAGVGLPTDAPDTFALDGWSGAPGDHVVYCRAYDREGSWGASDFVGFRIAPPPVTQFSMAEGWMALSETSRIAEVWVVKAGVDAGWVSYTTRARSAVPGRDFREATGKLEFAAGERAKVIQVPILDEYVPDGTRELDVVLTGSSAGTELGVQSQTSLTIRDNDGDLATSSLLALVTSDSRREPGMMRVSLSPSGTVGEWRFAWETTWRTTGTVVTNLDAGFYPVEFRPSAAFSLAPGLVVKVEQGQLTNVVVEAAAPSTAEPGALTVSAANTESDFPSGMAGWRFVGEPAFRQLGEPAENLVPGNDLIEFRGIDGWIEPPRALVSIQPGLGVAFQASYARMPAMLLGASVPVALSRYSDIRDGQVVSPKEPYPMVGQLRTPGGHGSGIAVMRQVVLTAAHVLFDEASGQWIPPEKVQWFHERQSGDYGYEPIPVAAAGYYVHENYQAARSAERQQPGWKPGTVTPLSQEWDVAAVFFNVPIARDGQSGYLLAADSPAEWVTSGTRSMLAGYPFGTGLYGTRTGGTGRMHATRPGIHSFEAVSGAPHVFTTPEIYGLPGNSGGPLLVEKGSNYHPAAVFLGNLGGESVFRVIDPVVGSLIQRAASSALLGINFNFGGINQSGAGAGSAVEFGVVQFDFTPASLASSAGWRIAGQAGSPFLGTGSKTRLKAGTYAVEFRPVEGVPTPAPVQFQLPSSATAANPLVVQVNYAPPAQAALTLVASILPEIPENTPFRLPLQARGGSPSASYSFGLVSGPAGLSINQGVMEWTPAEDQGPSTNEVRVTVSDGTTTVIHALSVLVGEVNALPSLAGATNAVVAASVRFTQDLMPRDTDLPPQPLSVALVSGPRGLVVTNGVLAWTPAAEDAPSTNSVWVSVTDGISTVNKGFSIVVRPSNALPVLAGATNATIPELARYTQDLLPLDADLPAQPLTVALVSGPAGLVLTRGALDWTPTEAQGPSTNLVVLTVSDGIVVVTNHLALVVREVNQPPAWAALPDATVEEGQPLVLELSASDADIPSNTLEFTLVNGPPGMAMTRAGRLTWTPGVGSAPASHLVQVGVSDGALMVPGQFHVSVTGRPSPPSFDGSPSEVPGGIRLVIRGPGRIRLEASRDLSGWSLVEEFNLRPGDTAPTVRDSVAAPAMFYRLVRVP